jgi:nicotinamide-nucleotide amidase
MTAIILSIGDELTLGQTVDTNSAYLAQQLAAIGYRPAAHLTVPDDATAIAQAFEESVGRCDALIVSGGLGPTDDDLTRQALADFLKEPLELLPAALENVERFFRALRRDMPPRNRVQAMIPRTCEMIENTAGTAPGIYCNYQSGDQKTLCQIFIMPGVPKEMKIMFARDVLPKLKQQQGGQTGNAIRSTTLHTFGQGESAVADLLGPLMARDRNPSVGTTVANGYVSLRINAYAESPDAAASQLADTEARCRAALGDLIWGEDDQSLQEIVARQLTAQKKSVATAESCTGGLLAKVLTDVAGSSAYFQYGWVTYHNDAKVQLGVPADLLIKHGAVSEQVAAAMATHAQRKSGSDYALAVSGIAGPGGGSPEKPVGTVCFALATSEAQTPPVTRTFILHGDREMIRDRTAKMALTILRFQLLGKSLPF